MGKGGKNSYWREGLLLMGKGGRDSYWRLEGRTPY